VQRHGQRTRFLYLIATPRRARYHAGLLRVIRFNDVANRAGITGFVQQMGIRRDASGVRADIVMWFVRRITLVVAFDALGLPAVSQVLQQFDIGGESKMSVQHAC